MTSAFALGQTWTDLDLNACETHRLVPALQPERHAVVVGAPEHVFNRKATLDLTLARFVRRAVCRRLRLRAVAPFPLNGRAVELLEVVGTADDFRGEDNTRRSDADDRLRFEPHIRP